LRIAEVNIVPIPASKLQDIELGVASLGTSNTGLIVLPDIFNTVNRNGIIEGLTTDPASTGTIGTY
jgi:hypothetical protein